MRARLLASLPIALLALAGVVGGLGCSGADVSVDGRQVTTPRLQYTFGPTGPAWERIHVSDDDVAWLDRATGAVVHMDHTCERSQDIPLPALVLQVLAGFTEREFLLEESVTLDGREARHVVVRARLDGVPRTLDLYVMKKDGCVYDLAYAAHPDRYEQGREAFRAFVMGFRTARTPLGATP